MALKTNGELLEILSDWSTGAGPLYVRLADAIRRAVIDGRLRHEQPLLTERALAEGLSTSRGTVVAAYNLLRKEQLIQSRQGSGTWISASAGNAIATRADLKGVKPNGWATDGVSLTMANLAAPDELRETLLSLQDADLDGALDGHGYFTLGLPKLRVAIAEHYERQGLRTTDDMILVTSGSQQAISLIASFFGSEMPTIVEDPTYSGAIDAFRNAGASLRSVPLTADGVDVDVLRATIAPRGSLFYHMPVHNPTGTVITPAAQDELRDLAQDRKLTIVEDRTLAHVLLEPRDVRPLAADDCDVITVESTSKVLWGGLRVGWIRAAPTMIQRLAQVKAVADLSTSVIGQVVVAKLLGDLPRLVASLRARVVPRFELLTSLINDQLPTWSWHRPSGGLSLWVRLPSCDAVEFAAAAQRDGVAIVPGSLMSVDGNYRDHIRLPYVLDAPTLERAVERLAESWASFETSSERSSPYPVLV